MLSVTIICLLYGYFFLFVVTVEEICPQRVHAYCFAATVILVYCFFAFLFLFISQESILVLIWHISEFYTAFLHFCFYLFFRKSF